MNKDDTGKYFPFPVYEKTIGLNDFVDEISHSTSLTSTDVRATIYEIIEIFHKYLVRGHKVKLDGIGTFKVSFKGDGSDKPEDLTSSNIDRSTVRVTFVADVSLNQEMKNEVSFSKISEK
ncbi:MAG: HU family DNA-binding protein [Treponemataceae bacterium]|nr:HU family DNA-binding protein [Treponemataceae bacterium]